MKRFSIVKISRPRGGHPELLASIFFEISDDSLQSAQRPWAGAAAPWEDPLDAGEKRPVRAL